MRKTNRVVTNKTTAVQGCTSVSSKLFSFIYTAPRATQAMFVIIWIFVYIYICCLTNLGGKHVTYFSYIYLMDIQKDSWFKSLSKLWPQPTANSLLLTSSPHILSVVLKVFAFLCSFNLKMLLHPCPMDDWVLYKAQVSLFILSRSGWRPRI